MNLPNNLNEQSASFNILHLPVLLLIKCIERMDPMELIEFSLLSKRTKKFAAKICRKPVNIFLDFSDHPKIHVKLPEYSAQQWIFDFLGFVVKGSRVNHRKICGKIMPSVINTVVKGPKVLHFITSSCDGNNVNIRKWTEHLVSLFHSPVIGFWIEEFTSVDVPILKWLHNLQSSIASLHILGDNITTENAKFILDTFKVTRQLQLYIKPFSNFQYNDGSINVHTLQIRHAHWININNLQNISSEAISLTDPNLTSEDINCFIKNWLNGSYPKLVYFEVEQRVEDKYDEDESGVFDVITDGLDFKEHLNDPERPGEITVFDGEIHQIELKKGYDITRKDGMMATFLPCYIPYSYNDNYMARLFTFHVWSKNK